MQITNDFKEQASTILLQRITSPDFLIVPEQAPHDLDANIIEHRLEGEEETTA